MATTTTQCQGVQSKLRDLSEDESAPQVDSGVAIRPVDAKADAANRAGHYRSHAFSTGPFLLAAHTPRYAMIMT